METTATGAYSIDAEGVDEFSVEVAQQAGGGVAGRGDDDGERRETFGDGAGGELNLERRVAVGFCAAK